MIFAVYCAQCHGFAWHAKHKVLRTDNEFYYQKSPHEHRHIDLPDNQYVDYLLRSSKISINSVIEYGITPKTSIFVKTILENMRYNIISKFATDNTSAIYWLQQNSLLLELGGVVTLRDEGKRTISGHLSFIPGISYLGNGRLSSRHGQSIGVGLSYGADHYPLYAEIFGLNKIDLHRMRSELIITTTIGRHCTEKLSIMLIFYITSGTENYLTPAHEQYISHVESDSKRSSPVLSKNLRDFLAPAKRYPYSRLSALFTYKISQSTAISGGIGTDIIWHNFQGHSININFVKVF